MKIEQAVFLYTTKFISCWITRKCIFL